METSRENPATMVKISIKKSDPTTNRSTKTYAELFYSSEQEPSFKSNQDSQKRAPRSTQSQLFTSPSSGDIKPKSKIKSLPTVTWPPVNESCEPWILAKKSYEPNINSEHTSPSSLGLNTIIDHSMLPNGPQRLNLREIPAAFQSQRALYHLLTLSEVVKKSEMLSLKYNYNGTALLETTKLFDPEDLQAKLRVITDDPYFKVLPLNYHKTKKLLADKKHIFSLVIRSVDYNITEEDVADELRMLGIHCHQIIRVISKATNSPTSFVRVLLTNEEKYTQLLTGGCKMFGKIYKCEPSHPKSSRKIFQKGQTTETSTEEFKQKNVICSSANTSQEAPTTCTQCTANRASSNPIMPNMQEQFPVRLPDPNDVPFVSTVTMTLLNLILNE